MQEAIDKIDQINDQSNKTRYVGGNFNWVHTVDSVKLARRIAASASETGCIINLLLQVNVSGDPAKHGLPEDALYPLIETVLTEDLKTVRLRGLMTIGYRDISESETRRAKPVTARISPNSPWA